MSKLTIRFLIDGKQVDEADAEAPTEADLHGFIADAKRGLEEAVSEHEYLAGGGRPGAGVIEAMKRLAETDSGTLAE